MKRKAIALLVVMVGIAIGVASAQSTVPLTFRTPFPFVVGDQLMPAGEYTMEVPTATETLAFRNRADGNACAWVNNVPLEKLETEDRYRLVFHRYGDRHYLSEIWVPGFKIGRMIVQHPSEQQVAKHTEPQHVTLMLY
jgi:hypothetical protein